MKMADIRVREGRKIIQSYNNQVSLVKERNKDQRKEKRKKKQVKAAVSQLGNTLFHMKVRKSHTKLQNGQ